jgi:hypothetical protein
MISFGEQEFSPEHEVVARVEKRILRLLQFVSNPYFLDNLGV